MYFLFVSYRPTVGRAVAQMVFRAAPALVMS
jgi:hypothetical protein